MRHRHWANKSPLYLAVAMIMSPAPTVHAFDATESAIIRSISLVKKPVKATAKVPREDSQVMQQQRSLESDMFYRDITRALNQFPGVFATDYIVNGQGPLIAYNSLPGQMAPSLLLGDQSLRPLPYLVRSLAQFSPLLTRPVSIVNAPSVKYSPTSLVGGVRATTAGIEKGARIGVALGSDNQADVNVNLGQQRGKWGHLFQFSHQQRNSYRQAKSNLAQGMTANDVLIKISESGASMGSTQRQSSELVVHYRDYSNDESTMGINAADTQSQPMLRYSATALDNEQTKQLSLKLKHDVALKSSEMIATRIYYDDGEASFYQTATVDGAVGIEAADLLSEFEQSPLGQMNITKEALRRSYASGGINVAIKEQVKGHQVELGVAYHRETINDKYYSDAYSLDTNLSLQLTNTDLSFGGAKNTLTAKSVYLSDHWLRGNLAIDVAIKHQQFRRKHNSTQGGALDNDSAHSFGHISLNYHLTDDVSLLISGHEGVLPSTNWLTSHLPQTSRVVRSGLNYQQGSTRLSLIAFNNEFYNAFSRCHTIASCLAVQGDRHDVSVRGAEVIANYSFDMANIKIPLSFSYTYRDHEYAGGVDVLTIDEPINIGDELAFLPKQQAFAQIGLAFGQWNLALRAIYQSEQRRQAGQGMTKNSTTIAAHTLVDLSATYTIDAQQHLFATLSNAADKDYVASGFNGPNLNGRQRALVIGYRYHF